MRLHLLFILCLALFCVGCVESNPSNPDKEFDEAKIKQAETFITTASYDVPVVDGHITTVSYKGLLLARTSNPLTIKVPKASVARGSNDLEVSYKEGTAATPFCNLWQTILFEDSKQGDFDYNDLVFHANYQINGNTLKVSIHPIALGSTKTLKLRFKLTQGGYSKVVKVSENCRTDLFQGASGFINTRQYDTHYPSFAKTYTIELPNGNGAVDIAWFMNVDNEELIYAVNQNKDKCLDENGLPYGYAFTNINGNGAIEARFSRNQDDSPEWGAYKPNVSAWANMPAQPALPAGALDLANLDAWNMKQNTNYVVKAGATYNKQLQFVKESVFYVQGTLNLNGFYGTGAKIVVLPGGALNINSNGPIQGVEILNYGKLNLLSQLTIGKDAILKSNQNITLSDKDITAQDGTIYIAGDISAKNLSIKNNGRIYANSLHIDNETYSSNDGILYVNGSVSTAIFNYDSKTTCYINCSLTATTKIALTNTAHLNVKGYINTPELKMTSGPIINMMSGGIIEANFVESTNCKKNQINIIGSGMGAIVCDKINFQDTGDIRTFLTGNLGVVSNEFQVHGKAVDANGSDITKGNTITFNRNEISIPESECAPGFNGIINEDNGFSWFAYPRENVNISDCYFIEEWQKGNFTFTRKSTADVFDIESDQPNSGGKYKIYEMVK